MADRESFVKCKGISKRSNYIINCAQVWKMIWKLLCDLYDKKLDVWLEDFKVKKTMVNKYLYLSLMYIRIVLYNCICG